MSVNKLIVTHEAALRAKYGPGLARVHKALRQLVKADRARGLSTRVAALDDAAEMGTAGAVPVAAPGDERAVKVAIDALWNAHKPEYLVILGAPDVVPMQTLRNPALGDGDAHVPSDLPYASAVPHNTDSTVFLGPTRVVGRLPDLVGATHPRYLVRLIATAARARSRPRDEFQRYFGVSAQVWAASTTLSLKKVFGGADALATVPPRGATWPGRELARRAHFINCHGADAKPQFYGQPAGREEYPVAHDAKKIARRISDGTVIAAECCYGAQLYDPADSGGQAAICSTYLADGAYGFFGSTTIAYGPSEGNGQADLICQFFLDSVLNGASLGRAALEARQRFAALYTHLDPSDLKTLAQFYLLGDPSIQPVADTPHAMVRTKTFKRTFKGAKTSTGERALRRERLVRTGLNLQHSLGGVRPSGRKPPAAVTRALNSAAREARIDTELARRSFFVAFPKSAPLMGDMRQFVASRRHRSVHLLIGRTTDTSKVTRVVVLTATVHGRRIVHLRRVHSR